MASKTFTTTAFTIIKFSQQMEPATLLAKPLFNSLHYHFSSLGVNLTNFVPLVVILA
jgi:hypothetical protein